MAYKYHYDSDADVLSITLKKSPYDHVVEMGDFLIHVNKHDQPVYLEVLNARQFILQATKSFPDKIKESLLTSIQ